ncbi:trehalase family glycosidase [Pedobacter gandavensis]|uniref:trehalase family glycosidase n=1 Tax=Pedobacter gandavensis TaxID=2679963 RepID=UPI0029319D7B|nr:trehalase family glycosidase [Pedobacter gandavensis]
MKRTFFLYLLICACFGAFAQDPGVTFKSSDPALETAFVRAKEMALSYKGKTSDPVGPWYESALPPRSAFCMRDVAHQTIGGEVLGLHKENKNMLRIFVKGISASKDWCSFWEMNHLGKPAVEDYRNDEAFWYNLNANFDVITASWKLYLWTGDEEYIKGADFVNFQEKSVNEFIDSWVLQADSLLSRPTHPNAPVPFNVKDNFHRCRGLPSYSEGVPNIKMGVDLVAALYSGLNSYANILDVKGQTKKAKLYREKAAAYQKNIDTYWWNEAGSRYNTFYSDSHKFGLDEGETFLLWFDALKEGERKEKTIQHLLNNKWNVENLSYFPLIMYQNGQAEKAYEYMLHLTDPGTKRREYPEVSFGVVKGFTEGLMGMEADARIGRISTLYRGKKGSSATLKDVPVLNTLVTIKHDGNRKSTLTNHGAKKILWQAEFLNDEGELMVKKAVWVLPKASREVNRI